MMLSVGRNDPCPCGSGKKSKNCCGTQSKASEAKQSRDANVLSQLLQRAVQHHRSGQTTQAEALYQQVLQIDPNQADALHLLGVIAAQSGNHLLSAQLIERAIRQNPRNPAFHNNLGNAYRHIDASPERCINCYRSAIKLEPNYAEAHNNLANALKRKGDLKGAIASYKAALRQNSGLIESSLGLGDALRTLQRYEEASSIFQQLAAAQPDCIDARIGLGATLGNLGQMDDAETALLEALRLNRKHAGAYYNLGLILRAQQRFESAVGSLSTAISLQPFFPEAYYNLGLALQANSLHQAAEHALLKALEQAPENALALLGLADAQASLGKVDEAISACKQAIAINPQMGRAHYQLALFLKGGGESRLALESLRMALQLGENTPSVLHMIAALDGSNPKTATTEYVAEVFDGYAARFDSHLVESLKYDSPRHLLELARQHSAETAPAWRLLDLGCGTGLCGVAFAAHTREMVGVDLSAKMLDKARARGLYQRLEQAELLHTMRAEPAASYDKIIAADVFVYIGDLADIYAEAQRLLSHDGLFLFSVESGDALLHEGQPATVADYQLLHSGRYAHAAAYLRRLAAQNGLHLLALESKVLRMENNAPIIGWHVALAR